MPVGIAHLNEVCVLLWSVIISILLTFVITSCKSSDLFMINPHISLNPWNSWISSAILRFHEDFHCEIHGFCEQSSDLAQRIYFIKSLSDLRVHSSALFERESVLWLEVAIYTIFVVPLSSQNCNVMCSIESWTLNWQICVGFLLLISVLFI